MADEPPVTRADLDAAVAQIQATIAAGVAGREEQMRAAAQSVLDSRMTPEAVGKLLDSRITHLFNMLMGSFGVRFNVIILLLFSFMALINVSVLQRVARLPTDLLTDMAYATVGIYVLCLVLMLREVMHSFPKRH